jgi:protein-S-isoprenylcysteine O-methyltransferase Ste14
MIRSRKDNDMSTPAPTAPQILSRILAAVFGGYGFAWGFSCLAIALLVAAGMEYHDAWMLVMLVVFLLFLALFCWACAARSVVRVWTVLAGGGAAMTLGAWLLTRHLMAA